MAPFRARLSALGRILRGRTATPPTRVRVDGDNTPGDAEYESLLAHGTGVWFVGDDPLDHPGLPELVARASSRGLPTAITTHAGRLDNVTAHRLLVAGLRHLEVKIAAGARSHAESFGVTIEDTLGNIERLLLMRDARRLAFPQVSLALGAGSAADVAAMTAVCERRLPDVPRSRASPAVSP